MKLATLSTAKTAIWGYGLEGQAAVQYLRKRLPEQTLTVLCPAEEVPAEVDAAIRFVSTPVDSVLLDEFDVVIKSPGITPYQPAVEQTQAQVISASALWFANERRGQVIAITGTKGKSTTAAMLTQVIKDLGHRVVLAGNFGQPLINCIEDYDFVVLETSSYQAQDGSIEADLAVLLNLFSEHLNWHRTEAWYHQDKWRLLQQADAVLVNAKDHNTQRMLRSHPPRATVNYFQTQHGFYELNQVLMYQDKALISKYGWQLKGAHNVANAAAVCAIAAWYQFDLKSTINSIKRFKTLPHRMEPVPSTDGIQYINDSIASTPHATQAAMQTLDLPKAWVLVGGYDRGVDWQWWVTWVAQHPPKGIICSGENGKKIHDLLLNQGVKSQCMYEPTLQKAVKTAQQLATSGDTILMSPGAPSFDAFKDYQHRGQQFIQWLQ